jgi:hypothetical protein
MQATLRRPTLSGLKRVTPKVLALTALASVGAAVFALATSWPLWAVVSAALVPWAPVFWSETAWTKRQYGWLALFYVLAITQTGHLLEHAVQMLQIHVLHEPPPLSKGVFGQLDIEWVHFVWNTWVLVALAMLAAKYRDNRWLLGTLLFALWHEAEHISMIISYVSTGVAGSPGLLAQGGKIGGGLPIKRPDLHFIYNLVETVPLLVGFDIARRASKSRASAAVT